MQTSIEIDHVEKDGKDGIQVTFSDGTQAGYLVGELLELRPKRKALTGPAKANPPPPARASTQASAARRRATHGKDNQADKE